MHDLPPGAFDRADEAPDALFYRTARLVTHLDDRAIGAVTQLYREYFPPDGAILDLMSSWVSHLPPEVRYHRVVGVGMNRQEMAANPRLDEYHVQDLNQRPQLPFADGTFDAAGLCVSIQYLTRPVQVLREVGRVLRPGAPLVITFSNRCFPTKAVAIWLALDDAGHGHLVERYATCRRPGTGRRSSGWTAALADGMGGAPALRAVTGRMGTMGLAATRCSRWRRGACLSTRLGKPLAAPPPAVTRPTLSAGGPCDDHTVRCNRQRPGGRLVPRRRWHSCRCGCRAREPSRSPSSRCRGGTPAGRAR